jgi:PAS domain-containing protein
MLRDLTFAAFDAVPSMVFVVDDDVRVIHLNAAALSFAGNSARGHAVLRRAGEALHCLNSVKAPGGCGKAPECGACPIRLAVAKCRETGLPVRTRARLQRVDGADTFVLLAASPFEYAGKTFVLLMLEDPGEVLSLPRLVPICMHCRRVRSEANQWDQVEKYVSVNLAVNWTHGVCDDCLWSHYQVEP